MNRTATARRRGFTLVELLFVFSMLGILASIAVPTYGRSVLRADAAELSSRLNATELAVREAQAMDGTLPAVGADAGVVPASLRRFLEDGVFAAPHGITMRYVQFPGLPFGVDGMIPAVFVTTSTDRGRQVLDALTRVYPHELLRVTTGVLVPFEGIARQTGQAPAADSTPRQPPAGEPSPSRVPPPVSQPQPQSQPVDTPARAPTSFPQTGGTPGSTTPSGGTGAGSTPTGGPDAAGTPYAPPPDACLGLGRLPPGQQRKCSSGGGQSAWFRGGPPGHGNH